MENHTIPLHVHEHDHEEQSDVNLLAAKVIAMIILGLVSFILGMIPMKLASWLTAKDASKVTINGDKHDHHHHHRSTDSQPIVISLLLAFGGGVLLYTTFLHLQPEVREGADELSKRKKIPAWFIDTGLSLSDVVFCCGFFFVYLVEESVHWLLDRNGHEEEEEEAVLHRTMSLRRCNKSNYRGRSLSQASGGGTMIPRASLSAPAVNGHHVMKMDLNEDSGICTDGGNISVSASTQGLFVKDQISVIDLKGTDRSLLDPQIRMFGGPLTIDEPLKGYKDPDDELSTTNDTRVVAKSFRGLLAVLALSFHAIFEGLAVGLEDSVNSVMYMFAAIATHKFVIAFCVGIGLVSSNTRLTLFIVYVATFAMVTPVGIGIGIALSDHAASAEPSLLSVVLQGMAAGTLLYVIFFEVLQKERSSNSQSGVYQLASILAGFCLMLLLQLSMGHTNHNHYNNHNEAHDHGDHVHDHHHAADIHHHEYLKT